MVRLILLLFIARAEARLAEPLDYLRRMLRASIGGLLAFARLTRISLYRRALPVGPFHVVRILAARHEDCGACVQTTVNLAKADGRPLAELRAVVEGRPADLPPDLSDVYRFVDKLLRVTHDEGELRERIRSRYAPRGDAVLSEIALVLSATRAFPVTKRALGYATQCQKVDWAAPSPSQGRR